jgi:hypothetical protein
MFSVEVVGFVGGVRWACFAAAFGKWPVLGDFLLFGTERESNLAF